MIDMPPIWLQSLISSIFSLLLGGMFPPQKVEVILTKLVRLAIAGDVVFPVLGRLRAAAPLRNFLIITCEKGLNLWGDLPLVHGWAPLFVHLQLFPQGTDGSLLTGHQFLQVLVPQLLPGSTFPCTLTTSLQLRLQVNLCRFTATFSWLFYFTAHHLVVIHFDQG